MAKLSIWFYHISSGWLTLVAVVIFVLFSALVLPTQSSGSRSQVEDIGSPDLSFYYSALSLYEMAEAYGEQGRAEYIRVRFSFDLIWPLVYTFFFTTTISWLYKQTLSTNNSWRRINLLPIMGMVFDFLENLATSIVMARYPAFTPVIDLSAGLFTMIKWLLIGLSFIALIIGIIIFLWVKIRMYRSGRSSSNDRKIS